eukprot:403351110
MASALSNISQLQANAAQAQQLLLNQAPPVPQDDPIFNDQLIRPSEVMGIWNSSNPKQDLIPLINRYIEVKKQQFFDFDQHDQYENWWEVDEKNLLAEYCLHQLCFAVVDLNLIDQPTTVAKIVNLFVDIASLREKLTYDECIYNWYTRYYKLKDFCVLQFNEKNLNRDQVRKLFQYANTTVFKHLAVIAHAFSRKREEQYKTIKVTIPEPMLAGNLATNCREIIEEKPQDDNLRSQQDFYENQDGQEQQEEEQEDEIDPEDPLYGLDQRLRNMNIDDESRRIIKEKLEEANGRIKNALEDRQKNLDSKLGDKNAPKKNCQDCESFVDIASLREKLTYDECIYNWYTRYYKLKDFCVLQFNEKNLNRDQVRKLFQYANTTVFKHLAVIAHAFSRKREEQYKTIKVTIPEPMLAGNLATNCREIIEEKPQDDNLRSQQDFYENQDGQEQQEEEQEDEIDPEDPLYGLDQRLRNMNIDDESRRIIKEKLEEANGRIKNALEDRQKNLDSKLGDKNAPKKK